MRTLTKYTSAAGSEARSRPRTLLLCLNTQGRLIIMNYGNTRYLSPFSSPIAPPSGVLLARPRTSFIFLPGLATLTPGFKSTVRYRSCLLRAKVRQLHQFSLRGIGLHLQYRGAIFPDLPRIQFFWPFFQAIFSTVRYYRYIDLLKDKTLKSRTHAPGMYLNILKFTEKERGLEKEPLCGWGRCSH